MSILFMSLNAQELAETVDVKCVTAMAVLVACLVSLVLPLTISASNPTAPHDYVSFEEVSTELILYLFQIETAFQYNNNHCTVVRIQYSRLLL